MQSRLVSLLQEKSDHSLYLWSEASGVYMDAAELVKSQATTCRETMVIVILNGESGIRYRIFSYKLPSYRPHHYKKNGHCSCSLHRNAP